MNVFDLAARLMLDKKEYDKGLDEAESKGSKFGAGLKAAAGVTAAGIAAVGSAAAAAGTAIVKNTGEVAEYGDNIDKMSQKMGISAEAYQEWDAIMQHSGTTIDALKPSMKTLANAAQEGDEAFQKLGISEQEVATLSQEDLFARVITGLQGMEEGTERTAITAKLLGRGATELGALLNTSAEDTEKMRQRVHELGGVMSNEAVKAAATYQDTLQDMQTAVDGLKRNLVGEFMPAITEVMSGLTEIFTGNTDEGLEQISEGITGVVDTIAEILPQVLEIGGNIVLNLGTAIIDNLPTLATSAVDMITTLASGIVDNLPMILQTGIQVLLAITQGVSENLPTLIPAMVDAIVLMADTLTQPDNLLMLIDTAVELIMALVEGLAKATPKLIKGVWTVFKNLGTALGERLAEVYLMISDWASGLWDKFKTWGKDLIDNFISGIKQKFTDIKNAFKEIGELIKSLIGFSEPKEGPLSQFHTFAPDMIDLFIEGINSKKSELYSAVSSAFDFSNAMTAPQYSRGNVPHGKYQRGGEVQEIEEKETPSVSQIVDNQTIQELAKDVSLIRGVFYDPTNEVWGDTGVEKNTGQMAYALLRMEDNIGFISQDIRDIRDIFYDTAYDVWDENGRSNTAKVGGPLAKMESVTDYIWQACEYLKYQTDQVISELRMQNDMFSRGIAGVEISNTRELKLQNV